MKKIITIVLFVSVSATLFAQYNQQHYNESRDRQYATSEVNYNNSQAREFYKSNRFNTRRERDFEIDRINREFRMKVYSIKRDPYLRHHQKRVAIRVAEDQRSRQIQFLDERFKSQFPRNYGRR
jgi:uncharacterized protein YxeA